NRADQSKDCRTNCPQRSDARSTDAEQVARFPRFTRDEADLLRRLSALIGVSRRGEPWGLARLLVALASPDLLQDIAPGPETRVRDGEWAIVEIDLHRHHAGWTLIVRAR